VGGAGVPRKAEVVSGDEEERKELELELSTKFKEMRRKARLWDQVHTLFERGDTDDLGAAIGELIDGEEAGVRYRQLRWGVEVKFIAPEEGHNKLAARRLREVADHLEQMPPHALREVLRVMEQVGNPCAGMVGAPMVGDDITSGWSGIWRVEEPE
jgi:hypothetical protein